MLFVDWPMQAHAHGRPDALRCERYESYHHHKRNLWAWKRLDSWQLHHCHSYKWPIRGGVHSYKQQWTGFSKCSSFNSLPHGKPVFRPAEQYLGFVNYSVQRSRPISALYRHCRWIWLLPLWIHWARLATLKIRAWGSVHCVPHRCVPRVKPDAS